MRKNTYFQGMNIESTHFAVIGRTEDDFCDSALQVKQIDQVLHEELKSAGFERIIFYSESDDKVLYCLDEESKNPEGRKPSKEITTREEVRLVNVGPFSQRISLINKPVEQNEKKQDSSSLNFGPMGETVALNWLNEFMKNTKYKTALVITNAVYFIRNVFADNRKRLESIITSWRDVRPRQNVVVWVFKDNCDISALGGKIEAERGGNSIWTTFFADLFKDKEADRKGTIINIPSPDAGEIKNYINYLRISKNYPVDISFLEEAAIMLGRKAKGNVVKNETTGEESSRKMSLREIKVDLMGISQNGGVNAENIEKLCGKLQHESAIERLNKLEGLQKLKEFVYGLQELTKQDREKNKSKIEYQPRIRKKTGGVYNRRNLHVLLTGNPGTGKTTVAKILGDIYRELGLLPIGGIEKVTRKDLVSDYQGQTAGKTYRAVEAAIGSVLFLDEAYALVTGTHDEYGIQARDTLLEAMSDRVGEFSMIMAGYPKQMDEFIRGNAGFTRRFAHHFQLDDYSPNLLSKIYCKTLERDGFSVSVRLKNALDGFFKNYYDASTKDTWGNAGTAEGLAVKMKDICKLQRKTEVDIEHIPPDVQKYLPEEFRKYLPEEYRKILDSQKSKFNQPQTISASELRLPKSNILKTDGSIDIAKAEEAILFIEGILVDGKSMFGTGFLITPQGHFITCNHVIEGAHEINARVRIRGMKDAFYKCELINTLKDLDIALLKLDAQGLPYLNLERDIIFEYEKGAKVCLFGYPFGSRTAHDCTFTNGEISSTRFDDNNIECVNLDISAKSGNSGGPLIDKKTGNVVGILPGSMTDRNGELVEEINYMRPIKYFWKHFIEQ